MKLLAFLALGLLVQHIHAEEECDLAPPCDETSCSIPDCACTESVPGVAMSERPQIVYLTFNDALTQIVYDDYYDPLFNGAFTNPNGCPIRSTHFITHQFTDYTLVHLYWSSGHEIAVESVTKRPNTTYWATLDKQGWTAEFGGMRDMAVKYGNIQDTEIEGIRSYSTCSNDKFQMMEDIGLGYDSSMSSRTYGYDNLQNGFWPYSLDYENTMYAEHGPCPNCSFPNIWEQPMLDLEDAWYGSNPQNPDVGQPCTMLDSCIIPESTAEAVYDMIMKNFNRSYYGNTRAPFGLHMHYAWFFGQSYHYEGYLRFVEEITNNSKYPDVWVVPVMAGIEYRKDPKTNDDILQNGYAPFDATCPSNWPIYDCPNTANCTYEDVHYEGADFSSINMKICCPADNADCCPPSYPWINNVDGTTPPTVDP